MKGDHEREERGIKEGKMDGCDKKVQKKLSEYVERIRHRRIGRSTKAKFI